MRIPARLQLLTCLLVYASSAHAIMVKFGTKDGPIEPPTPEPSLPPPQPSRAPAPVWEERTNDSPDPNAQWRPRPVLPQPRYTQVIYRTHDQPQPINNAQAFVNAYKPETPRHQPVQAQPVTNYFTPSQILGTQSLPGIGLRYLVPAYVTDLKDRKQQLREDDAKHNEIELNEVHGISKDVSDVKWQLEKDIAKRLPRTTLEATPFVYQWPVYVPSRH